MRFCPTKAFFLCLTALPILLLLNSFVGLKASPQCGASKLTPVAVALGQVTIEPEDDCNADKECRTKAQAALLRAQLRTALNWDFLFIPIYTLGISVLCFTAARIAKLPTELTWVIILLVVLGMPVDASENFTLIHIINTHDAAWATTASWLGKLKLVAPSLGILYAIGAGVWGFVNVDK